MLREAAELLPNPRERLAFNNLRSARAVLSGGREGTAMKLGVGLLVLAMLLTPAVDGVAKALSAVCAAESVFATPSTAGVSSMARISRPTPRFIAAPAFRLNPHL